MKRNQVPAAIIAAAESGFGGTNSQWARQIGSPRQSTHYALRRLVEQDIMAVREIADGIKIYAMRVARANDSSGPGARIIVEIGSGNDLIARWDRGPRV